jgi:glycerol-3-phosphate O-acyltransferase / dihydroxyacetone phosphate acyltransferase
MWLLPFFPWVARIAAFVYYRIRYDGERVPRQGPVLLVANHPNSLLDPLLVVAAARRPVRFLAKAPLFSDAKVGWLVRAAGAIPVYRRADDPTQMDRNEEMFRAVHAALAGDAAVGIFPEGLSHSEPALAPLRTGAARIALGACALTGRTFPVVPVGLVFRQKDVFRSEALVLVGQAVPWDDVATHGNENDGAVRTLTDRIAEALRQLTVNLEGWQDQPLVDCAMRIWEAERGAPPEPGERVARLGATTRVLAAVRRNADPQGTNLARDVEAHRRRLRQLGLRPADLVADVGLARSAGWAVRRVPLVMPLAAAVAIAGVVLFWVPYRGTGLVVDRMRRPADQRSTYKLLVGIALYAGWILALGVVGTQTVNIWAGLSVLLATPVIGMAGLVIRERWRGAGGDLRRFLLLRSRRDLVKALRAAQRDLGVRLNALYQDFSARGAA